MGEDPVARDTVLRVDSAACGATRGAGTSALCTLLSVLCRGLDVLRGVAASIADIQKTSKKDINSFLTLL